MPDNAPTRRVITDADNAVILRYRRQYSIEPLAVLVDAEKAAIQKALFAATNILGQTRGMLALAAKLLGIDRSRLRRKIILHNIETDTSEVDSV